MTSLIPLPSSSSPSSPSSARPLPFPPLPMEIKRHILAFADTGTLASCSRASLAFLEIASELLYENVEIIGEERLVQFFGERSKASSSQVEAFRACVSRLKSFTFTTEDPSSSFAQLLPLPSGPLPVKLLVLKLPPTRSSRRRHEYRLHNELEIAHIAFLSLFNPTSFRFEGFGDSRRITRLGIPTEGMPSWNRVQLVHFVDTIPAEPLRPTSFSSSFWEVTYELTQAFEGSQPGDLTVLLWDSFMDGLDN